MRDAAIGRTAVVFLAARRGSEVGTLTLRADEARERKLFVVAALGTVETVP